MWSMSIVIHLFSFQLEVSYCDDDKHYDAIDCPYECRYQIDANDERYSDGNNAEAAEEIK